MTLSTTIIKIKLARRQLTQHHSRRNRSLSTNCNSPRNSKMPLRKEVIIQGETLAQKSVVFNRTSSHQWAPTWSSTLASPTKWETITATGVQVAIWRRSIRDLEPEQRRQTRWARWRWVIISSRSRPTRRQAAMVTIHRVSWTSRTKEASPNCSSRYTTKS